MNLPHGLTIEDADVLRRREHSGEPVDVDEGRREVAELFEGYVERVRHAAGPTDLRGDRDELAADLKKAQDGMSLAASRRDLFEEVCGAAVEAGRLYGLDTRAEASIPASDRVTGRWLAAGAFDRWQINVVTRPDDGIEVVTLWLGGRREQGRCAQGLETWAEVAAGAEAHMDDWSRTYSEQANRAETAALRKGVIVLVLKLHREGKLDPAVKGAPKVGRPRDSDPKDTLRWWRELQDDPRCRNKDGKFIAASAYGIITDKHNDAAGRIVISPDHVRRRIRATLKKTGKTE